MGVVEGITVGSSQQLPSSLSALGDVINGIINTAKNVGTILTNPNQNQVAAAGQQLLSTFGLQSNYSPPPPYQPIATPVPSSGFVPLPSQPTYGPPAPISTPIYSQQFGATFPTQPISSGPINVSVPVTVSVPAAQSTLNFPELLISLASTVLPNIVKSVAPETSGIVNAVQGLINNTINWQNNTTNQFSAAIDSIRNSADTLIKSILQQNNTFLDRAINSINTNIGNSLHEASTLWLEAQERLPQEVVAQLSTLRGVVSDFDGLVRDTLKALSDVNAQIEEEKSRARDAEQSQKDILQLDVMDAARKILHDIIAFFNNIIPSLTENINALESSIGQIISNSVKEYISGFNAIFSDLDEGKINDYSDLINRLSGLNADKKILWSVLNLVTIMALFHKFTQALAGVRGERIEQLALAEIRPTLLSPGEYIEYLKRNNQQLSYIVSELHKLGLADDKIKILQDISVNLLDLQSLIQANLRGFLDDKRYDELLNSLGYDDESKRIINHIRFFYPPAQDLISMLVHEVFSDESRKKYNLDADYPPEFTEIARKAGLDEVWAKNYWANHWQYPSPEMVFEMLHRSALEPELAGFSIKDVDDYLKVADYAPIWRPRLRAISYSPLTRVDIRRIYKQGGKSRDWLHKQHLALGYNDRDANELDNFVIETQLPEDETDLSKLDNSIETTIKQRYIAGAINDVQAIDFLRLIGKSDSYISKWLAHVDLLKKVSGYENETESLKEQLNTATLSALKRGNISNTVARNMLIRNGLTEQQADMRIAFANLQYTVQLKAKAQDIYTQQFAVHNIDENQFKAALSNYGFSASELDNALNEARLERLKKIKKPSEATIGKWYAGGIISRDEAANELAGLGYDERYIGIILRDIEQKKGQA